MQEVWDMSFLVDDSAKIIEARGQCREHIGDTVQQVVGGSFLSYLAPEERLHFRKFLAQISKPNAKRATLEHFPIGMHRIRRRRRSWRIRLS